MPLEAMFQVNKAVAYGGGVWLPLCKAWSVAESWPPHPDSLNSLSPQPGHEEGECERCDRLSTDLRDGGEHEDARAVFVPGKSMEEVELQAVYSSDPESPNYEWAQATPAGNLTMTISNPEAWGFFEPGAEYRLRITKHIPANARSRDG